MHRPGPQRRTACVPGWEEHGPYWVCLGYLGGILLNRWCRRFSCIVRWGCCVVTVPLGFCRFMGDLWNKERVALNWDHSGRVPTSLEPAVLNI